jgi:hypothetical protein
LKLAHREQSAQVKTLASKVLLAAGLAVDYAQLRHRTAA